MRAGSVVTGSKDGVAVDWRGPVRVLDEVQASPVIVGPLEAERAKNRSARTMFDKMGLDAEGRA